jgi:hypothetical protein
MPYVGFQKLKGTTISATSMNIVQKSMKEIIKKSNVHFKVLAWMTK